MSVAAALSASLLFAALATASPVHASPDASTSASRAEDLSGIDDFAFEVGNRHFSVSIDGDRLLATGCWIGMDRYGLDIYLPTDRRNATVLALLERGRADRMFLSQDYCSTIDWFPLDVQAYLKANEVPKWSMTFLFEEVIPALKERGMTDDQLNQMMVENPKRWLA